MCATIRTNTTDTAVMRAKFLDLTSVLGPPGSKSTLGTASCVTSGTSSERDFCYQACAVREEAVIAESEECKRGCICSHASL